MSFPTFDADRTGDGERNVQHEIKVVMRVDQTDEFITVPLRSTFVDDGLTGWVFEVGPYSVTDTDARNFANAIAHFGELSGQFRPVKDS